MNDELRILALCHAREGESPVEAVERRLAELGDALARRWAEEFRRMAREEEAIAADAIAPARRQEHLDAAERYRELAEARDRSAATTIDENPITTRPGETS